ncbi:MAG TPA: hypothetical protein VMN04_03920 [Thermoanaerobaculia bacterium]|nr:hypothetical protein [Thermoanaerobaculia bacterium]
MAAWAKTGTRAVALLAGSLLSAAPSRAAGFFDGVPARGYVIDDVSLDALSATGGPGPVARLRYVRLSLDPGRRDIAFDFWPQREMLLVEHASGEKLIFERLTRLPAGSDPSVWVPRGRIGLEGSALETFGRSAGTGGACASLDLLVRAGNVDLPLASADLPARTVRTGVAQVVEAAVSERQRELVAATVPILLAARTQGLPAAPLEMLELLFPGRDFARSAQALSFRPSRGAPLDPAAGAWRAVTEAPDMLPGVPVF